MRREYVRELNRLRREHRAGLSSARSKLAAVEPEIRKHVQAIKDAFPRCRSRRRSCPRKPGKPESRTGAVDAIRALIETILLEPDGDHLKITLKGDLAGKLSAARDTKRSPNTGDLMVQIKLVAGAGFEPATFGL